MQIKNRKKYNFTIGFESFFKSEKKWPLNYLGFILYLVFFSHIYIDSNSSKTLIFATIFFNFIFLAQGIRLSLLRYTMFLMSDELFYRGHPDEKKLWIESQIAIDGNHIHWSENKFIGAIIFFAIKMLTVKLWLTFLVFSILYIPGCIFLN